MEILRIKEIMLQRGISREELAKKVKVSKTTISNISSGTNHPKPELLLKLAKALDVDIRELFISTKGGQPSSDEVEKAVALIKEGVSILNKK